MRMDRTMMVVVTTETPSDATAYWRMTIMAERMEAFELTRQLWNGYGPDASRMVMVLDLLERP